MLVWILTFVVVAQLIVILYGAKMFMSAARTILIYVPREDRYPAVVGTCFEKIVDEKTGALERV